MDDSPTYDEIKAEGDLQNDEYEDYDQTDMEKGNSEEEVPVVLSQSQDLTVNQGSTVYLPCDTENAGR